MNCKQIIAIGEAVVTRCEQQIAIHGDDAETFLTLPGKWGETDYRKFLGVQGEIVCELDRGVIVAFTARKIKEAVERELLKKGAENE